MSKRKTEQAVGSKKKSKSTLEALEEDLALKPNNGRQRMAAPPGVERFSDSEDDTGAAILNTEFKKGHRVLDSLLKIKGEKVKRRRNVEQMQAAHVSDSEEDDEAAEQMTAAAQQQARELQGEEDPEPVVLHQVLFPAEVQDPPECSFAGVEDLIAGCTQELHSLSGAAASKVDLPCALLLNGWLQRFCFTSGKPCSAALIQNLFQLLALSQSLKVATAAFKTLMALLGDTHQYEALLGCHTSLPTLSSLYDAQSQPPALLAVPSDQDFVQAFKALGLAPFDERQIDPAKDERPMSGNQAKPAVLKGTLYHLQLLLRTLPAVCRYHTQAPRESSLKAIGLFQLLLILLSLRLDPVGQLLAIEVQMAMEAVLSAVDDKEWENKFAVIAHQAAQLGPSHRAHLAALKQLPAQCNRGYALQQAGVGYLLRSLCLTPKKGQPKEVGFAVSAGSAVDPQEVIEACSWFQAGGASVAKACQGEQALYSLWELETCINAADLLLWPHIKKAKELGTGGLSTDFRSSWQEYIQALSRGMSNSHKVAAHNLKLHIAVMQAWDNRTI